jgi:hypothetical protein
MAKHRGVQQLLAMLPPKQLHARARDSGENNHDGSPTKLLHGTAADLLFMTKMAISLLLFLPILQNNMMSSFKQSSSLIRYLQLWLKVHHQTVEGF